MKIASWNLKCGLSDADSVSNIYDGLGRLDADIVFMPEAFDNTGQPVDPDFAQPLGYAALLSTGYEDAEEHPSGEQYILALSRVEARMEVVRLDSRNALKATFDIEDETASVTGVHCDDRNELTRMGMVNAYLANRDTSVGSALIGDKNAMHGNDPRARALSHPIVRSTAAALPPGRMRSLATRLTDMATGDVMRTLEEAGFQDADPRHRPTMLLGGFAVVQLDHFMYDERLQVHSFQVERLRGSDHLAVSGELALAA